MSRIGKQSIIIPKGVKAAMSAGVIVISGPKGELSQAIHPEVLVEIKEGSINLKVKDETNKVQRALWGLFGSLIKNMISGVTAGFSKQLEIKGVGFNASVSGEKLVLKVGFSHLVEYNIPDGIEIKIEANIITITGIDKQLVGEAAAQIRRIKKPEPYKGKGIKYIDEYVRHKAGKTAAAKTE